MKLFKRRKQQRINCSVVLHGSEYMIQSEISEQLNFINNMKGDLLSISICQGHGKYGDTEPFVCVMAYCYYK